MRVRITAPVQTFRGEFAGMFFADGVAEVDDSNVSVRAALEYCRRRGYAITAVDELPGRARKLERPKDYASKAEWVSYATSHPDPTRRLSDAAAHGMTKQELVDLFSDNTSNEEGNS